MATSRRQAKFEINPMKTNATRCLARSSRLAVGREPAPGLAAVVAGSSIH
jgi:hypothetical protein